MSWNYRIVRYKGGDGYGLHEVFYDADGQPWSMTDRPVGFVCDEAEDPKASIRRQLMTAATDARLRPIFDEPETWPGKAPGDR